MNVSIENIKNKLKSRGLKITPQRIAILEAVYSMENHPNAEQIIEYIRKSYPGIATGTVYKVLDTLAEKKLICKVKTDKDVMRYDGMTDKHHHLYCSESERIADFIDEELDEMLSLYFKKKNIDNFMIEDIKLQINGKFIDK